MANKNLDFEKSLELTQVQQDTFVNVHTPWVWHSSGVVSGGLLMSEAAAAAYHTIDEKQYTLDNVQAQFLASPNPAKPIEYKVTRLSQGRRFAVRSVIASQNGRNCINLVIGFMHRKDAKPQGPIFQHCVSWKRQHETLPEDIPDAMDDLHTSTDASKLGPWMKFCRLPLIPDPDSGSATSTSTSTSTSSHSRRPEATIAPVIARIHPTIKASPAANPIPHILGLLNLSDYHVLDAPLSLHGIPYGMRRIEDDNAAEPTRRDAKFFTSLNHSVHLHVQPDADNGRGWRADEIMYIEVVSPWGTDGRAYMQSRIYTRDGRLVATCVQEAYYVLEDGAKSDSGSKL